MASNTLPRQSALRSEQMLQHVLVKDGVARKRSLSRGSSSATHMIRPIDTAPPMPPVDSPAIQRSIVRSSSSSAGSSGDERPMLATNGLGAANAVLYRPHMPTPRKTHDGASFPRSHSPSPPHHPQPHRHTTSPPPLIHDHSSPMIHGGHSPTAEWAFEESSSPGSMSFTSSGSASQLPGTPSTPFDPQAANEHCRQQSGYVSFGDIAGLGWPAGEEEDERLERQRMEIEMKRRNRWWGWIEDSLNRPKTPAHAQDNE